MTLNIQLLILSCILDLVLCSKDLPSTTCTKNHTQQTHRAELLTSKFYVAYIKNHTNVCTAILLETQGKRVVVSLTLHGHTYKHNREVSLFLTCMHARACTHTQSLFYMYFHSTSNLSLLSLGITTDSLSNYSSTLMLFITIKKLGVIIAMKSVTG